VAALEKHSPRPLRRRAAPPKIVVLNNALLAAMDPQGRRTRRKPRARRLGGERLPRPCLEPRADRDLLARGAAGGRRRRRGSWAPGPSRSRRVRSTPATSGPARVHPAASRFRPLVLTGRVGALAGPPRQPRVDVMVELPPERTARRAVILRDPRRPGSRRICQRQRLRTPWPGNDASRPGARRMARAGSRGDLTADSSGPGRRKSLGMTGQWIRRTRTVARADRGPPLEAVRPRMIGTASPLASSCAVLRRGAAAMSPRRGRRRGVVEDEGQVLAAGLQQPHLDGFSDTAMGRRTPAQSRSPSKNRRPVSSGWLT